MQIVNGVLAPDSQPFSFFFHFLIPTLVIFSHLLVRSFLSVSSIFSDRKVTKFVENSQPYSLWRHPYFCLQCGDAAKCKVHSIKPLSIMIIAMVMRGIFISLTTTGEQKGLKKKWRKTRNHMSYDIYHGLRTPYFHVLPTSQWHFCINDTSNAAVFLNYSPSFW